MTETEWLRRDDSPEAMLIDLYSAWHNRQIVVPDRKLRFFSCACCRHVNKLVRDQGVDNVIHLIERHVDGLATNDELRMAGDAMEQVWNERLEAASRTTPAKQVWLLAPDPSLHLVEAAAYAAGRTPGCHMTGGWYGRAMKAAMKCRLAVMFVSAEFGKESKPVTDAEVATHRKLLHDCVGSPFRPVTLERAWRTPRVMDTAQAIYREQAFQHLPLLVEALEEAGCTTADIVNHGRHQGPHVRGCWLIDLVLQRA